jgi:hypothetical protein
MQPADRDARPLDALSAPSLRGGHLPAHLPLRERYWNANQLGDLAEGHLAGWEAAWIDLGGEG